MQTTIVKWGNSQGVRLPKYLLDSANLSDNDTVDITVEAGIIFIRKSEPKRRHRTLKERLEGVDLGDYPSGVEWDTGPAVGHEILPDDDFSYLLEESKNDV